MEHVIVAEKRTEVGKGPNNRLRAAGRIPAVVYGHDDAFSVSMDERDFMREFKVVSESTILNLKVGKEKRDVLIKDYQEDVITGRVLHVDFYEVEAGKKLRTHVALHLVGTPNEVREGGILENPLHEVEIECLPKDLVEAIDIPIENLTSAHALHVGDITPPTGIRIVTNSDAVVAAVVHQRAEAAGEEDEAEEGATETPAE
ncbi:50S ribosomal protein L25 [Spirochaeta africana]|uniref:Large ribosomal subunit protein bL25 n=1 Tax=Spirochaeta africana (strain ATCC 700263 / DSM 8902 / Z-7692) TaxID=889378 RepID=H9UK88_SPIAZ|nr:50S ribosomal protein L25 [Spirochaeta africana]AFG37931.1 ribosomal protein L25, Ctc-form [Spirochaeta africana DSM 8902]